MHDRGENLVDDEQWCEDPALRKIITEAEADQGCVGLLLSGSRSAGLHDDESDYDLVWVLADDAFGRHVSQGRPLQCKGHPLDPRFDIICTCRRELRLIAERASWELPGYATARVLFDRAGQLAALLNELVVIPAERADADVLAWFDAYLNGFYRSLKTWRRGNELGARLQAAESVMHLVRVLFAMERRWPPYHDRLHSQLALLDRQGWPPGYLAETLLVILRTSDPTTQQELELRVEALLHERGFTPDLWDGEIDRVKAWRFDKPSSHTPSDEPVSGVDASHAGG